MKSNAGAVRPGQLVNHTRCRPVLAAPPGGGSPRPARDCALKHGSVSSGIEPQGANRFALRTPRSLPCTPMPCVTDTPRPLRLQKASMARTPDADHPFPRRDRQFGTLGTPSQRAHRPRVAHQMEHVSGPEVPEPPGSAREALPQVPDPHGPVVGRSGEEASRAPRDGSDVAGVAPEDVAGCGELLERRHRIRAGMRC